MIEKSISLWENYNGCGGKFEPNIMGCLSRGATLTNGFCGMEKIKIEIFTRRRKKSFDHLLPRQSHPNLPSLNFIENYKLDESFSMTQQLS